MSAPWVRDTLDGADYGVVPTNATEVTPAAMRWAPRPDPATDDPTTRSAP